MKRKITRLFLGAAAAMLALGIAWRTSLETSSNGLIASEGVSQSRSDTLAEAITTARYSIDAVNGSFFAENPANRIGATFTASGVELITDSNVRSRLRLSTIGYGIDQREVIRGDWLHDKTRITAKHCITSNGSMRSPAVEEWFDNRPEGLEQGFILDKRPDSEGDNPAPLRIVLNVDGDLIAAETADGQAIELANDAGTNVLRYEKLKVWDSQGQMLTARMTTAGTEIWLDVEDAAAAYPITIDPTYVHSQKLTRPDSTAGDHFGEAIAPISSGGSFLAVGAPQADVGGNQDQGAVYLFKRSTATSNWTFVQKIMAEDGAAFDNFGSALGRSSNSASQLWIGAPNANIDGKADQGAVYRFAFSSTTNTWTQFIKATSTDGLAGDNFGSAIFQLGTDIYVSAPNDDVTATDQGSVYWIEDDGGHRKRLNATDAAANDNFGSSIYADYLNQFDKRLIVGADQDDIGDATNQGSVYILDYDTSSNTWNQSQKLLAPDGALGDNFGTSLARELDGLYVGATGDDIGSNSGQGSVHFYERVGNVYVYDGKITAADGEAFDRFGSCLDTYSFYDEVLVVGAPFADVAGAQNAGAVYKFNRTRVSDNHSTFRQSGRIASYDGGANDHFGSALALTGPLNLYVSSPDDDVDQDADQGSVYVMPRSTSFDYDGDGRSDLSVFRPSSGSWYLQQSRNGFSGVNFGLSSDKIVPADYDGDGRTDIAIYRPSQGTWYISNSFSHDYTVVQFGVAEDMPAPADYDGDGRDDIAVFRPSNGTWYIRKSFNGSITITQFGASGDIPAVGDFTRDGKADISVFRPSDGSWYRIDSRDGNFEGELFGVPGDRIVPADYDGDTGTDIAVYRPSDGTWFIRRGTLGLFDSIVFGISSDVPVPGDYDGDGRSDLAVFRSSSGYWYMTNSSNGSFTSFPWGQNGDRPTQNAFGN